MLKKILCLHDLNITLYLISFMLDIILDYIIIKKTPEIDLISSGVYGTDDGRNRQ